ncbi:cupredoxin domain-containing protein [Actinacidiphila sp. ITFR-21]|uniref:cupredoxin domain-containing protein n=1 Tax=Actinacidiphila sp. ITFR-21 TaxID=3075199 RepID=UPI00288BB0C5|nr:cupredoxin domain-containing protein [Streptomyces sp. ITFR-21]WNI18202.1 cupredoxin domain-containing protein [Streptomyces sp. ITFR-21]
MTDTRRRLAGRRLAGLALAGTLLALTGCSDSGSGGSGGTAASPSASAARTGGGSRIVIKDFAFSPAALTVSPGATVTVLNQDSTAHTVTADTGKSFDTGTIAPGRSATFTAPEKSGSLAYICTIHPFMKGTLTVG